MNNRLISRCEEFVAFKDSLDRFIQVKDVVGGPFVRCAATLEGISRWAYKRQRPALCPSDFIRRVLPFSDPGYDYDTMTPREIECGLVIGGTIHENWVEMKPDVLMDGSNALGKSLEIHPEKPRYAKIGRLPLYVALEGKNRVEVFKAFRQTMEVWVTDTFYPEPEALTIHKLLPWGLYGLKYQDELRYLPFAKAVLPLLREYGVKDGATRFNLQALLSVWMARKEITSYQMMP